ncbi:MAG: S41 family peptidase [Bacteroidota bacterium]|nr:S41 family peptidase [Bacteroidota bacterium]
MNKALIIIFLTFTLNFIGQECDCFKNISLLQQKIEDNQASYQHQVIEKNQLKEYLLFKNDVNKKAKTLRTKRECIGLIAVYLNFFRDEHSSISYNENYSPDENRLVISKTKKVKGNKTKLAGLWYFQDGSFSVNITNEKTALGEWIALMQSDKSSKWENGQVKIEFFKAKNGALKCIYWRQNLVPKVYDVSISDSSLHIGRSFVFYRKQPTDTKPANNIDNNFVFSSLSKETNYLKLPSFDLSNINKIDSLITANKKAILSKNNLIIDLRNNGGGGFDAFKPVLPFVMDNSVVEPPYYGSVWVSKDNFNYYDSSKYGYAETKQDSINELNYVTFLKEHLGKFTPIEKEVDTLVLSGKFPARVALIFNRYSASTAEGFILQSKYSKKVKTFGENSAGAVSYGDWMPFELPELNSWVAITTKKSIFKHNEDFESIGISPDVDLKNSEESNWIEIVVKELEKQH